jgi:hypothetical protein
LSTVGRIRHELEEIEDALAEIINSISQGNGDFEKIRETLETLRREQVQEIYRLSRRQR